MSPAFGPLLLMMTLPAAPALKEKPGADRAALQGVWRMEACTYSGTQVPVDVLAGAAVEVRGDRLASGPRPEIIHRGGGEIAFRLGPGTEHEFKLDSETKPKRIDLRRETKDGVQVLLGIYRVDGDRVEVCLARGGERPAEFRADEKSDRVLWVLRRAKR
jgi:uncharacterized protein (TIGR03067 family)